MVPAQGARGNSHLEPHQSTYKIRMLLMKLSRDGEGIRCEHVWYRAFLPCGAVINCVFHP